MLLAIARLDAPDAFANVDDGNQLLAGRIDFGERGAFDAPFLSEGAVFIREVGAAGGQFQLTRVPEGRHLGGGHGELKDARVEIGDVDPIALVVFGRKAERVGLDAEVDVLRDQNGGQLRRAALHAQREGDDPAVHAGAAGNGGLAVAELGLGLIEDDAKPATVGQSNTFTQAAVLAKTVEHARDGPCILTELAGFAFEAIDLFNDFNGDEDEVLFEAEDGVGIVEEDVGVENVVFHRYI